MWTHRWAALVLGVLLVLICTSGVPLLYTKEIYHLSHPRAYNAAGPATISFAEARESIRRHDRNYQPQSMWLTDDVELAM